MLDTFLNLFDVLAQWLKRPEAKLAVATFEWIFYILIVGFIVASIWLRVKSTYFEDLKRKYGYYILRKKKPKAAEAETLPIDSLKEYWQGVVARLNYQDEAQWKLAVIEADNLFDHVLKLLGYEGESLGERLQKITPGDLKNLNDIWQVHKIRNALVHDTSFKLVYKQAEEAINTYEQAFRELKVLE